MAKLNLKKFIAPEADLVAFHTRADKRVLNEANENRKEDGYTWQELFEALLKTYNESKKEKSHV